MSLRAIAKELEISPAYLSYMINGKRPWRKDLHQRYLGVVNSEEPYVNKDVLAWASPGSNIGAGEGI